MATQKQIKANRQNAQKSTGPKTDEGKAAVSQNALKHGIFADSVIKGENPAEFEAFHDEMLTELAPAGAVETMMAERIVSLWWRLRRAERMQNQVIDDMMGRVIDSNDARYDRECYYIKQDIMPGDPRMKLDDLPLGRITAYDWSRCRVLERMMLYERRIENSMIRLTKELRKQQLMSRIEQRNISEDQAIAQTEALMEKKINLKKQSQFMPDIMGVTPFMKGDYGRNSAGNSDENKAKQSQFDAPEPVEAVGKREISAVAQNSLT